MKKLLLSLLVLGASSAFAMGQYQVSPLIQAVTYGDLDEVKRLLPAATQADKVNALQQAQSTRDLIERRTDLPAETRTNINRMIAVLNAAQ